MPEVRFDGFSEDWEFPKLEEVVEDVSGNEGRTDLPILTISAGNGWMNQKDRFSQVIAGNELKNYTLLKKGELSYNHGNSKLAKYGAVFELKDYEEALVPRVYHSFKSNDKSSPSFLEKLFSSKIPDRELGKLVTSGARMDGLLNINKQAFFGITISVPKLEEQQKIGTLFKQLDDTIALHQQYVNQQQQYKKAMLQRMFPNNGEKFPELRFPEFTNAWENRKLSDGTSKIGDGLHGTPKYTDDGDVYFINGNNLVNGEIIITEETKRVTTNEQSKDDKALNENTLLMSINGTIGNLAWYKGEKLMLGKSAAYITVSDFDKKFIYAFLQTDGVRNYFLNNLTGTTIKNLGLKTIRETKLFVPEIEEQSKIGSFFAKLDHLITLHQKKLEDYQHLKKALLQRMFV